MDPILNGPLVWRKSSYSTDGNEGDCVEIACLPDGRRAIRDSKNAAGPMLVVSAPALAALSELPRCRQPGS